MKHYRVVAPHFVAAISTGGRISRTGDEWIMTTAPILKWAKGWTMDWFRGYAQRKGWTVECLFGA